MKKEITVTLYDVKKIVIDTQKNDSVDIKCGGPQFLGFDFFVDADEDINDYVKFIQQEFKKHNKTYISLYVVEDIEPLTIEHIWNKQRIAREIKRFYGIK